MSKYVNQPLALPGITTIFTYIVNVENIEKNTQHLEGLKDVLPQGGFLFCNGTTQGDPLQSCDAPMYKLVADNADPSIPNTFTDTIGFTSLADPALTYNAVADRWELIWDDGWGMTQAGMSQDTLIMRFQAEFTPIASGSFYNEIFVDVSCSVPSVLKTAPNDVSSQADYCASYSWPSGGSLVPTNDVRSETDSSNGWGNITVGSGSGRLESWYVESN